MKNIIYAFTFLMFTSCSTVRISDSWRSRDYFDYRPQKVLIIGITENLTARKKFEGQLRSELERRGVQAVESHDIFTPSFLSLKQTEEDIEKEMKRIAKDDFDAVLISAVKGVEEKTSYSGDTYFRDYYWRRWGRYYYLYQDVYFVEGYYNQYSIYHIEATLYNLKAKTDKSLVWAASYDIVNPESINNTVNDYVNAIIKSLQGEGFINSKR